MKKQLLSIFAMLLSLLMLVSSIPLTATAATSSDVWNGTSSDTTWVGTGSSTDPYQIASAAELKGLSVKVNSGTDYSGKYFKQTADIDLGGKDWTPIGTSSYPFKSNYNGDGHTISNLHVDEDTLGSNLDSAGLFGHVNGGTTTTSTVTIENLSVIGGEIQSNEVEFAYNSTRVVYSGLNGLWKAGVIAANAMGLKLNNVYTDVNIYPSYNTSSGVYAGGLIGNGSAQITITACVAKGNISFYNEDNIGTSTAPNFPRSIWIGGLIGNCAHGGYSSTTRSINGSFYTGTISVLCCSNNSATRVGGLAGGWMNKATINNCYMLGNVDFISTASGQGSYAVGTIVGFMGTSGGGDTGTKITNTKIYNQYENSNTANTSANYFYASQPVGRQGAASNGEISVSTLTSGTNNPIILRAYQYGIGENDSAFRLLATISSLDYREVGYTVTAVDGERRGTWDDPVSGVYETIRAGDEYYTAADEKIGGNEGDYIAALVINDIPESRVVAMEVTPYVVLQNGDKIHGNTAVFLFKNGKMTDCYGLQNENEADRITALGTDLSNFKIIYDGISKETASHVAAPDLYRLILKKFGIGLDVEKKSDTLPTHYIYLKETSDTYGNWTVTADETKIYINANDICGFSAGVSHLIETWSSDKNTTETELVGSGSLQSRTNYDSGETANGNFGAFDPVYTLTYSITNTERTLSYHKDLLDDPAGQTVIYAHRGEHKYYPEASLEAYISAWYSGASIVDVDIQQTKDNVWVCMHNTKLNATTNVDAMQAANGSLPTSDDLADWTYVQLQQLNLLDSYGKVSSFKIPKLEEVLDACAGNVYVGLDDKTTTYTTPSAHKELVSSLGASPAGLMLRSNYQTIDSNNEYNGVKLPGIIALSSTDTAASVALTLVTEEDDVTNLMIPASNPDYYRYVSKLLGTGHFAVTRQYKDQVRFFAWMQYKDTDTPAVWAEAEANGYDTFGTNHCIAMMEHIKSSAQN